MRRCAYSLHPEDDYSDSDSRSEIVRLQVDMMKELLKNHPSPTLEFPHEWATLWAPPRRPPWRFMLSGDMLHLICLSRLAHAKPILDLNLSNLNVSDDVIVKVIAMDGPHLP